LFLNELEGHIRTEGRVSISRAGLDLSLDLSKPHERRYAAYVIANVRYPQFDLDGMLFKQFVMPGDVVLDAGANIGFTALQCLDAGARVVHTVEPIPEIAARLKHLPRKRIVVHQAALSDRVASVEMTVSQTHNQGSSYRPEIIATFPYVYGETPQRVKVPTTTIDRLCRFGRSFNIWKLDIEGAEVDAIKGGARTLEKRPPRVIMAELWSQFYDEFASIATKTHPHVYKALISQDDYRLVLLPPDEVGRHPTEAFHETSPMFVFLQQPSKA